MPATVLRTLHALSYLTPPPKKKNTYELSPVIPILLMKKLKLREVS